MDAEGYKFSSSYESFAARNVCGWGKAPAGAPSSHTGKALTPSLTLQSERVHKRLPFLSGSWQ